VIHNEDGRGQTELHLRALLASVRVNAEPVVVVTPEREPFHHTAQPLSSGTDLTLLGMKRPQPEDRESYSRQIDEIVGLMGTVLLVHSANEEELLRGEA
jgi:hypothetical protein